MCKLYSKIWTVYSRHDIFVFVSAIFSNRISVETVPDFLVSSALRQLQGVELEICHRLMDDVVLMD